MWYGNWKKGFLAYDCVLLHGTWLAEDIPHWMRQQAKKAGKDIKIIWWYWNTVVEADNPDRVSEQDCEKWSFDKEDCKKYHMHYNTQYYFKSYRLPSADIKYDACYLGTDGGRKEQLVELQKKLEQQGFTTDFRILVKEIPTNAEKNIHYFTEKVDYQENLKQIAESRAIVEILRPGQTGQTLRPLEALFHKKKLITNDVRIKEYDYYCPENIFVLGEDDWGGLKTFLTTPVKEIPEEIVKKYDGRSWLERFSFDDERK